MTMRLSPLLIAAMFLGLTSLQPPAHAVRPAERLRVEYAASYPANFYYVINALAGDHRTNSAAYQGFWNKRFRRNAADDRFLDLYRKIRSTYRGGYVEVSPPDNPYLPLAPRAGAELSVKFSSLFLSCDRWEDIWPKADILLTEEDAAALRSVFDHFRPRFDTLWQETAYLKGFTSEFKTYSRTLGLDGLMAKTAAFCGTPSDRVLRMRVNFVFGPPADTSHGRQLGPHLLVEVRPHEKPTDRVGVVAHEMTHYFFERAHVDEAPEFLASLYGTGDPHAGTLLGLLNEGLATAVGQGIVQQMATPRTFERSLSQDGSWYRNDAIDSFAKAVYPVVSSALKTERPLSSAVKDLLASYRKAVGSQPPSPRMLFTKYALLTDVRRNETFQPYFEQQPPTDLFTYGLASGAEGLRQYRALPALIAVTSRDLATLGEHLTDYGLEGLDLERLRAGGPGAYVRKRPTSGYVCVVYGPDEPQLSQALVRFITLGSISEGWVSLSP